MGAGLSPPSYQLFYRNFGRYVSTPSDHKHTKHFSMNNKDTMGKTKSTREGAIFGHRSNAEKCGFEPLLLSPGHRHYWELNPTSW